MLLEIYFNFSCLFYDFFLSLSLFLSETNLCFILDSIELLKEIAFYWGAINVLCMKIHTTSRVINSLKDGYLEFLSQCKLVVSGRMGNHKVIKECRLRKSKLILRRLNYLMHFKYIPYLWLHC